MKTEGLSRLPIAWQPERTAFVTSPLGRMAAGHGIDRFDVIAGRALEDPEWFWAAAADDLQIPWIRGYDRVLDVSDGIEFARFFPGARLNWADYAVDRWVRDGQGARVAIRWEGDDGAETSLTYSELKAGVDRAAGALAAAGVEPGDVVALLMPMIPEAAMAIFAAAKIGAIVAPMFSGFGPRPIRERLEDSNAKVLVTCDGFSRRGRHVALKAVADEAAAGIETLRSMIVVRRSGSDVEMQRGRDLWWHDTCDAADPFKRSLSMDAGDPCLLLYTSGSTGRPKGCVHTHGGMPLRLAIEARYAMAVDETTTILWVTDMGWVMGSYLLSAALVNGGIATMFEGTPDWPDPGRLWGVAERCEATLLGVSPTLVRSLMAHGSEWPRAHDLSKLRTIGSSGEPWNVDPWLWCFREVGRESMPIVNFSGGTECGASIVSSPTFMPAKPTSFSGPALGMAADVVDEHGRPLRGAIGELVVRAPWPGMTKSLWGPEGDERYLDTYWRRFEGCWHQGDLAFVDDDGFWFLLGRSDDTLKLAGKRVGPAEVESILVEAPDVVEAAAVGIPDDVKGEALACFVVVRPATSDDVVEQLVARLQRALGKAMTPKVVLLVPALPKTRSGKIMRRVVRAHYIGEPLGDLSALDNPEVLDQLPQLQRA